jgi:apolipoprotein N-acyltransferase
MLSTLNFSGKRHLKWSRTSQGGVIRGQLSHFDDDERILLVHLPRHGRTIVYARLGEWFAVLSGMLAALALVRLRWRG